jgi:hypothetical protein
VQCKGKLELSYPWCLIGYDAPLVEGEWLDGYVVALAEWGARLQDKGYLLKEPEDSHPMAWYRVVDPESGAAVDDMLLKKVWHQTEKHLDRFPGRTRNIRERPYLHFQGYLRWRGRKARGSLEPGLRRGLVLDSWNRWVEDNGSDGAVRLESVKVGRLNCYLEGYRYRACLDSHEAAQEKRRRESLLQDLRGWKPGSRSDSRYHRRISDWGAMAGSFLFELYSLRQAADAISQKYFDGYQVPFPAVAEEFARLIGCLEELVEGYNEDFANELGQETSLAPEGLEAAKRSSLINTAALDKDVPPGARQHTAFLVDMARAEALDAMGENQAAVSIIERHI